MENNLLHPNATEFDGLLNKGGVLVADFWATWCGPCRMYGPIFEETAQDYAGRVAFAKIDIDQQGELTERYGVQSVPTTILFKNGSAAKTLVGVQSKVTLSRELDALL